MIKIDKVGCVQQRPSSAERVEPTNILKLVKHDKDCGARAHEEAMTFLFRDLNGNSTPKFVGPNAPSRINQHGLAICPHQIDGPAMLITPSIPE